MRIKRIRESDMRAALERVREQLGPEAVIISTRALGETAEERRRGLTGVEIVAGVDEAAGSVIAQAQSVANAAAAPSGVVPAAARAAYALQQAPREESPRPTPDPAAAPVQSPSFRRIERERDGLPSLEGLTPAFEALAARQQRRAAGPLPDTERADGSRASQPPLDDHLRPAAGNRPAAAEPDVSAPPSRRAVAPAEPFGAALRAAIDATEPRGAAIHERFELSGIDEPHLPSSLRVGGREMESRPPGRGTLAAPRAPKRVARPALRPEAALEPAGRARQAAPDSAPLSRPGVAHQRGRATGAGSDAALGVYDALREAGLGDALAEEALGEAIERLPRAALADSERLLETALARLVAGIPEGPALGAEELAGRVLVFVGAAGAGKTTAVIKAALHLHRSGADVGIVGADDSHLGAPEQITRYAQVLRLPAELAYGPNDLARIVEAAPENRITLVDTPAFSGDRPSADLAALLAAVPGALVILTAPALTTGRALDRLMVAADAVDAAAVAVTQLDDAGPGPALNVLAYLGRPALLCSTGRDVLADLTTPTAMDLAVHLSVERGTRNAEQG